MPKCAEARNWLRHVHHSPSSRTPWIFSATPARSEVTLSNMPVTVTADCRLSVIGRFLAHENTAVRTLCLWSHFVCVPRPRKVIKRDVGRNLNDVLERTLEQAPLCMVLDCDYLTWRSVYPQPESLLQGERGPCPPLNRWTCPRAGVI